MESLDFAIVGGGAIGWSAAWHLRREAPSARIAVIDKDIGGKFCSSVRGTGGFRTQFGDAPNIQLSLASLEFFKTFEEQTGCSIDFRQEGYCFYYRDRKECETLSRLADLQRVFGVPVETGTREDIQRFLPKDALEGVEGIQYSMSDGVFDGPQVRNGFMKSSLNSGVLWIDDCKVFDWNGKELRTSKNPISASKVVIASGHWSGPLAKTLGLKINVHNTYHQLCAFDPWNGPEPIRGMLVDFASGFHFRNYGEGILCGWNAREEFQDTSKELNDPEASGLYASRLFELMHEALPSTSNEFQSMQTWGGWYCESEDGIPYLDRQDNIVVAVGFGGHGVMHSPAAGRIVAALCLEKSPPIDVSPFQMGRKRKASGTSLLKL